MLCSLGVFNLVSPGSCFSKREIIIGFALQECYEVKLDKISKAFITVTGIMGAFNKYHYHYYLSLWIFDSLWKDARRPLLNHLGPLNNPLLGLTLGPGDDRVIVNLVDVLGTLGIFVPQ